MKNKVLVLLLILVYSITLSCSVRQKQTSPSRPAPEVKIGNADSFVLSNGLKVFVVENHKLPSIAFSLVVDRDPIVEGKNAG